MSERSAFYKARSAGLVEGARNSRVKYPLVSSLGQHNARTGAVQSQERNENLLSVGDKITLPTTPFQVYRGYIPEYKVNTVSRTDSNSQTPDAALEEQAPATVSTIDRKRHARRGQRPHRIVRGAVAGAAAAVALTTAACDSGSTSTSGNAPEGTAIVAMDDGVSASGAIDWDKVVNHFGKIPGAVTAKEKSVFEIVNNTIGVAGGLSYSIILSGTGSVTELHDQRVGKTAGHEIMGEDLQDGRLIETTCGDATENYPGGSMIIGSAASDYNPEIVHKNGTSPDLAITSPAPSNLDAIPLGDAPKRSEKVYMLSLQPLTPHGSMVNPKTGEKPSVIDGVVLGLRPGTKDQWVVLTGIGGSRPRIKKVMQGASGGPTLNNKGQDVGTIIASSIQDYPIPASGIPTSELAELRQTYGVKIIKKGKENRDIPLSFAIIQGNDPGVLAGDAANLNNKDNICIPPQV